MISFLQEIGAFMGEGSSAGQKYKDTTFSQPCENFRKGCEIFFGNNFFIRTLIWVKLVSLESLESVESRYVHKGNFRTYDKDVIFKMFQLVTFNHSSLLLSTTKSHNLII